MRHGLLSRIGSAIGVIGMQQKVLQTVGQSRSYGICFFPPQGLDNLEGICQPARSGYPHFDIFILRGDIEHGLKQLGLLPGFNRLVADARMLMSPPGLE